MKREAKKTPEPKDVKMPSPEPTPGEAKAIEAYKAAKEKRGPRLKVTTTGKDAITIEVDHPHNAIGTIDLMRAIGTTDSAFFDGLIGQLANASKETNVSERGLNFMLSVVKGIEPRDQIEAMLAAQMAAVHMASMTFARRLANVENIPQQDSAQNAFNKLARTFAAQVEALKRYRSGGEQKMTVQHVHVAEGGQAIVGNVSTPAPGVGAREKAKEQPHALAYAPGVEVPRQIEAERATVPRAGGARL
jgi:hypothetical protein